MKAISHDEATARAVDGILNNRLVMLAGAGLSMAPPSKLPSAAQLAAEAKTEYDARYVGIKPPLPPAIEDQAQLFFDHGELGVYLKEYINQDAFAGAPNEGHLAVADLLLSHGLQCAVTTNVDTLIEMAGQQLFGKVFAGVDGNVVAHGNGAEAPLLKLHGCWLQDPANTVWAKGQLHAPPVSERIQRSKNWLQAALLDKDLVIVGYSTDWDYLNEVITETLDAISPSSVLIVDVSPPAAFVAKAPDLAAIAAKAKKGSFHVEASGDEFLSAVRSKFSQAFIRRAISKGVPAFAEFSGHAPSAPSQQAPDLDNQALWMMRRDLLGCKPNMPARKPAPYDEPAIGLTLLQIREAGGVAEGYYWNVNGQTVRVLRASGMFLHTLEGEYRSDMPPMTAPDVVVAVGAEDAYLPGDLVRQPDGSITRGSGPKWMTRSSFEATL